MGEIVPRKEVSREGMKAVGGLAGGAALMVLSSLGNVPGLIVGGVITLAGLGLTASKEDRLVGGIAAGAGALTVLSKLLGFGGGLLFVGGAALLVTGSISLVNFIRKLKSRS
jgi:hypothetical protein